MPGHSRYDVAVVGAGTAGAALTARLSEAPDRRVLLVEAGPDYPDPSKIPSDLRYGGNSGFAVAGPHTWGYVGIANQSQPWPLPFPRGKVVGGTSAIDGRIHLRGIPEDYDEWAARGNTEWRFENILKYFTRMETDLDFHNDVHGTDGPLPVQRAKPDTLTPVQHAFYEACVALGFKNDPDMNDPATKGGVGYWPVNILDGLRISSSLAYLQPARSRSNLTILANALVRCIALQGKRATGIEVERGGKLEAYDADLIVLSAGSFNSPHLLLRSGIGPAAELRRFGIPVVLDLPGVGQNLQDHPLIVLAFASSEGRPDDLAPMLQVGLRLTTGLSSDRLDISLIPFSPCSVQVSQYKGAIADASLVATRIGVSLRTSRATGRVSLASSDPAAQPLMQFDYLNDPAERRQVREGLRLALDVASKPDYQKLVRGRVLPRDVDLASDEALDRWILSSVVGAHATGTCKMGPASDPTAVVDQYCRVHGIDGLRVVDGSVMPEPIRANTAATVTLIAEFAADHIGATS